MGLSVTFKGGTQTGRDTSETAIRLPALALSALRWMGRAVLDAHRRKAEREMARYFERSGGRLTDDLERRMVDLMSRSNFRV